LELETLKLETELHDEFRCFPAMILNVGEFRGMGMRVRASPQFQVSRFRVSSCCGRFDLELETLELETELSREFHVPVFQVAKSKLIAFRLDT
jgi:hypothetical protein